MFDFNPTTFASALLLWMAWALVCRGPVAVLVLTLLACAAKTNFGLYVAVLALVLASAPSPGGAASPWPRSPSPSSSWSWPSCSPGSAPAASATGSTRSSARARARSRSAHGARGRTARPPCSSTIRQKRRSLLLPLAATGYLGLADPAVAGPAAPQLGRALPGQPPGALVGLLLRHAGGGDGAGGRGAGRAAAAGGRPRRPAPRALRGRLRAADAASSRPTGRPTATTAARSTRSRRPARRERRGRAHAAARPCASSGATRGSKVAAQYNLLPHLAGRPFIYELDHAAEADVVALQLDGETYPDGRPAWRRRVMEHLGHRALPRRRLCDGADGRALPRAGAVELR